jgi:RNA polymerase-binding transcription factor DksA
MTDQPSSTRDDQQTDAEVADNAGRLRAEYDRRVAALGLLEAEHAALLADPSTLQEDRDATRLLLERARQSVAELEQARARVDEGTYGICERCGKPIPADRLEAMPDATTHVSC